MGGRRISELFYELRANTEGLKRDLDDGQRQLGKFSQFVERNPTAVVGALGVALAGVGIEAVHMAERSEGALRRIAVNIPNGIRGAEQLRESLKGVTEESGRSREETLALFETISKQGVTSAAEIETRALAIQEFADATNASTEATAAGLDQLMDAFGITADGAELALAKIASVAKGRAAVEDVLEALQAAAPTIAKFGLDFDTSIRALTQLMDGYGLSAGQAGKKLKSLDATDIRNLAKDAHIAADALQDLNDRANLVRDGADRASQKLKNDFSETMERLGVRILPVVNAELQGLLGLLDQLTQHDTDLSGAEATINAAAARAKRVRLNDQNLDSVRGALGQVIGGAGITAQFTYEKATELPKESAETLRKGLEILLQYRKEAGLTAGQVANVTANIETLDLALLKYATTAAKAGSVTGGTAGSGTRKVLPLTIEEKAAATAAILDVEKSVTEFGVMVQKTIAGTTKSAVDNAIAEYQALGVKIQEVRATIAKKATVRGVDSGELQAQRAQLDQFAQQALAAQREIIQRVTLEERTAIGDSVAAALASATGSAAEAARQAVERQTRELLTQVAASKALTDQEKQRYATQIVLADQLGRANAEAIAASERVAAIGLRLDTSAGRGQLPSSGDLAALNAAALSAAQRMRELEAKGLTNSQAYRDYQKQILDLEERRRQVLDRIAGVNAKDTKDAEQRTLRIGEQARALQQATDGAVQLAEAFGLVDHEAADVLRSVGQIAAGIGPLANTLANFRSGARGADGNRLATLSTVIGAALPVVGGLATLITASAGFGKNEALERNTNAIRELTKKAGLIGESVLGGRAGLTAVDIAERLKATPGFEDLKGSKAFPARVNGLTNEQLAIFKKAAADLGVAIDYSGQSWRDAANAILEAASKLGEFGTDWASQQQMYDARRKIFGEDTPDVRLNQIRAAATAASPALKGLFEAIDLTDPASLEVLRQRVKDLFDVMQSGGDKLTKEQLGDLTGDELLQALEQIIEDIDGLAPKAQSVAEKLATARGQLSTEFQILDTDVGGQLTKLGALYAKQGGALADLTKDLDLSTAEGAALLRERIQALFKTLEDPDNTVDLAGLSLEELIQALLDLKQGADAVATGVVSAAQKMQDAAAALKTDFEVYGTDQVGQVQQLAGLYGGVGGIGAALNGLDLSSAAGRTAAIAQLQQLYGGDKGNSEQTAAILELLRALRAVPGESAAAGGSAAAAANPELQTSGAEKITIQQADRLIFLTESMLFFARQTAQNTLSLKSLDVFLRPPGGAPILPPSLASLTAPAGAGGAPSIIVKISVVNVNHFLGDVSPDRASEFGDALGTKNGEAINRYMGQRWINQLTASGDPTARGT